MLEVRQIEISYLTKLYLHLFGVKRYIKKNDINAVKYYFNNYKKDIDDIIYRDFDSLARDIEYTPVLLALEYDNIDLAKILIEEFNADVNKKTEYDRFFAHNICTNILFFSIEKCLDYKNEYNSKLYYKYIDFCKYLIDDKADIFVSIQMRDKDKYNALHYASYCGINEIVEYILLKKTIAVDYYTKYGKSALYIAAKGNRISLVKNLITSGADVNITYNGRTPLYNAYENNKLALAKYLESVDAHI